MTYRAKAGTRAMHAELRATVQDLTGDRHESAPSFHTGVETARRLIDEALALLSDVYGEGAHELLKVRADLAGLREDALVVLPAAPFEASRCAVAWQSQDPTS